MCPNRCEWELSRKKTLLFSLLITRQETFTKSILRHFSILFDQFLTESYNGSIPRHWGGNDKDTWGIVRVLEGEGQFFNPQASSASVHHLGPDPCPPSEVRRHVLGEARKQPPPQLCLCSRCGRDGGPELPPEITAPPPAGTSDSSHTASSSSKISWCGPYGDLYS